jgi:biotin operon repressor
MGVSSLFYSDPIKGVRVEKRRTPMKNNAVTDRDLEILSVWNGSSDPEEASAKLGLKRKSVISLISRLRALGHDAKKMAKGRKKGFKLPANPSKTRKLKASQLHKAAEILEFVTLSIANVSALRDSYEEIAMAEGKIAAYLEVILFIRKGNETKVDEIYRDTVKNLDDKATSLAEASGEQYAENLKGFISTVLGEIPA